MYFYLFNHSMNASFCAISSSLHTIASDEGLSSALLAQQSCIKATSGFWASFKLSGMGGLFPSSMAITTL